MFTRKFGKLIRGNTSPFQIYSATLLGLLTAFAPSGDQAPGLYLLYLGLVVVLNANLFLYAVSFLLGKLVYFIALPVLFKLGIFLVDGPLNGLVSSIVNAPVLAWFGFEYYVTLPGIIFAIVLGFGLGAFVFNSIRSTRSKLINLEEGSSSYQKITANPVVKFMAWILFGGIKGKQSWKELNESKKGLPVRPLGLAVVVLGLVFIFVGAKFFNTTILTNYARDALAQINGATVDLDSLELSLSENRITINGLAFADPQDLMKNRFSTERVNVDLSGMDLLAKKVVVESISFTNPVAGEPRKLKGSIVGADPDPEPSETSENEYSILGVIKGADKWRGRLASIKKLYDKVAPLMDGEEGEKAEGEEEKSLSFSERIEQKARDLGYANVSSPTVIKGSPRLLIENLVASDLKIMGENERRISVKGTNLSDNPSLVAEQGKLEYRDPEKSLVANVLLPFAEDPSYGIKIRMDDLKVSEIASSLEEPSRFPFQGGSLNVEGSGTLLAGNLEIPLTATFYDSELSAFGQSMKLDNFPLTVKILGPLDSPKIEVPKEAIENAVKQGGRKIIEDKAKEKLGDTFKGLFGG